MMSRIDTTSHPDVLATSPLAMVEERERRLIEAVVTLARSLRDERDRLALRLHEVEGELSRLVERLDAGSDDERGARRVSERGTGARAGRL